MDGITQEVSPELATALRTFSRFLESDDAKRGKEIEGSEAEELNALANAVEPLYDEINAALDLLVAKPHPLPDGEERLEEDLNALAQAGMEARIELTSRSA